MYFMYVCLLFDQCLIVFCIYLNPLFSSHGGIGINPISNIPKNELLSIITSEGVTEVDHVEEPATCQILLKIPL